MCERPFPGARLLLCVAGFTCWISLAVGQTREPDRAAIDAIMASDPTSPSDLIRTAGVVRDLGDPSLARRLLGQAAAASLGRKELSDLVVGLGSPVFMKMATDPALRPEGHDLAMKALTAHREEHSDPANVRRWIGELGDESDRVRFEALESLRRAGGAAVAPLVMDLVDPTKQDARPRILSVLRRLELDARRPLVAMLESSDARTVAAALDALAEVGGRDEAVYLIAPYLAAESEASVREAAGHALRRVAGTLPDPATAAALLAREAEHYFRQITPLTRQMEHESPVWTYDDTTRRVTERWLPIDAVYRRLAARLARAAYQVAPERSDLRRLYLAAMLDEAAHENGLDQALAMAPGGPASEAAAFGVDEMVAVAELSLQTGHSAAAAAAIRILGQIGTPEDVLYGDATPSVVARAAKHADRRIRFAAVEAVMRLDPKQSYPGASDVLTALLHLGSASGRRLAIVAGPNGEENSRVSGYLLTLGYEVELESDGRGAMALAAEDADTELLLVDSLIQTPTIETLSQRLRADCRSAAVPVGVLARDYQLDRAEKAAGLDPLTMAFPRPHADGAVEWQVDQLRALCRDGLVPADVRLAQAKQALAWIAALYEGDAQNIRQRWQEIERLATRAILQPERRQEAIVLLRLLPTQTAQATLVDYASRFGQPIPDRQAAADALFGNIEAAGLRLSKPQVLLQYTRYNASEHEDAASQRILGSILDWIEVGR